MKPSRLRLPGNIMQMACALALSILMFGSQAQPAAAEDNAETSGASSMETVVGLFQKYVSVYDNAKPSAQEKKIKRELIQLKLANDNLIKLSTNNSQNKEKLIYIKTGDRLTVQVDSSTTTWNIVKIIKVERFVAKWHRLLAIGISLLILLIIAAFLTKWDIRKLIVGEDNRYSNSHFQVFIWFCMVSIIYGATFLLRIMLLGWDFIGGIDIPQNIFALTGLSAFTFGGAKMIVAQKTKDDDKAIVKAASPNILTDLVENAKNKFDFGDFQMLVITIAAVVVYALTGFHYLGWLSIQPVVSLPDVDTTLLSGFGIGQGAYLIKKAASKPGQG